MPDSVLGPVSVAIFARLNVASLKAAVPTGAGCTGGVFDNVPQGATFPNLFYEVSGRDIGGLGQGPDVTQIELRVHVFSTYNGMAEAQRIMREAVRLLKYSQPTITGYIMPMIGRPLDEIPLPWEEINGVKVRELVSIWDLFADEGGTPDPPSWVQGEWVQA